MFLLQSDKDDCENQHQQTHKDIKNERNIIFFRIVGLIIRNDSFGNFIQDRFSKCRIFKLLFLLLDNFMSKFYANYGDRTQYL